MERFPHPFGACAQVQLKGTVPANESDEILPLLQTDDTGVSQDVYMLSRAGLEKSAFFGYGARHRGHFL
ncbi:MAG: hypothetical protein JPMHGGIA_00919 [Saprospiraceae bacterium]|nr:hypothetical protein [Saprospiraceae bacterium]